MRSALFVALAACGGFGSQKAAAPAYVSSGSPSSYSPSAAIAEPTPDRPGLGTSFGESVYAPISFAPFERATSSPWAEVVLHYNDAQGVAAHAEYLGSRPEPLEVPAGDGSLAV